MKITLVQTDIAWFDPSVNIRQVESAILAAPQSHLYVLPEMWSTGFVTEPEGIAELAEEGEAFLWMGQMANRLHAAIAGSIVVQNASGVYYNRFYFIRPSSGDFYKISFEYYDKRHLFTYGKENESYTAGHVRKVVEWCGARFLLLTCYDLRFPVWSRNLGDYDCILCVASWPMSRISAWCSLLIARALENQAYVAGVNRIGDDPHCTYCGSTMLVDAYGNIVAQAEDNKAMTITQELNMEELNRFRKKFPVLTDRDNFTIHLGLNET